MAAALVGSVMTRFSIHHRANRIIAWAAERRPQPLEHCRGLEFIASSRSHDLVKIGLCKRQAVGVDAQTD